MFLFYYLTSSLNRGINNIEGYYIIYNIYISPFIILRFLRKVKYFPASGLRGISSSQLI